MLWLLVLQSGVGLAMLAHCNVSFYFSSSANYDLQIFTKIYTCKQKDLRGIAFLPQNHIPCGISSLPPQESQIFQSFWELE